MRQVDVRHPGSGVSEKLARSLSNALLVMAALASGRALRARLNKGGYGDFCNRQKHTNNGVASTHWTHLARMQRLRPCRSPYTEVHSRLCTEFSFFGYARYQLGSCALRCLSAAVTRLSLRCWRLWSCWLHWDQLRGSRRHPPHLLVELVLERREPLPATSQSLLR